MKNTAKRQDFGLFDFLPFFILHCNRVQRTPSCQNAPHDKMGCIENKKNKNGYCIQITVLIWSEWRDLNPRPLGPEPSALPSALHPEVFNCGGEIR